ncbi:hypothetical protein CPB84DRAFT_1768133 [Gymnopilus junonius]|uniref:Uncharacterized protein n=1 Tax=Gymnopilus junonius TaxID=109634 RepID=A0A9P5NVP3_GYMJU|nr:hypothetical protein CPB84DRAFT_1768133 [Gymnopilus junonius]
MYEGFRFSKGVLTIRSCMQGTNEARSRTPVQPRPGAYPPIIIQLTEHHPPAQSSNKQMAGIEISELSNCRHRDSVPQRHQRRSSFKDLPSARAHLPHQTRHHLPMHQRHPKGLFRRGRKFDE